MNPDPSDSRVEVESLLAVSILADGGRSLMEPGSLDLNVISDTN